MGVCPSLEFIQRCWMAYESGCRIWNLSLVGNIKILSFKTEGKIPPHSHPRVPFCQHLILQLPNRYSTDLLSGGPHFKSLLFLSASPPAKYKELWPLFTLNSSQYSRMHLQIIGLNSLAQQEKQQALGCSVVHSGVMALGWELGELSSRTWSWDCVCVLLKGYSL